jgi:hypothetical protein
MKKKKQGKIPAIKTDIAAFINEEEGAISKKDALNLGLSLLVLGTVLADTASAHSSYFQNVGGKGSHHSVDSETYTTDPNHSSAFSNVAGRGVHNSSTHTVHTVHSSCHTSHSSCHSSGCSSCHGSHGSHSACHSSSAPSCHSDNCYSGGGCASYSCGGGGSSCSSGGK